MARRKQSSRMGNKKGSISKRARMANNTTPTPIHVSLDKLVTLAEQTNFGHTNKRLRILHTCRRLAQGSGRKKEKTKNN